MIAWLVEALAASALLMALVLVVRAPVRRLFGPQVAYALWALPVLRLVLPPLPAGWREQAAMPISRAGEAVSVLIVAGADRPEIADAAASVPAAATAAAMPAIDWPAIVAGGWVLGALIFFVWHCGRHRRFCRGLLARARLVGEVEGVRVVESPAAAGPLAFGLALGGIGRRFVAFPDDFADRYDADERALALAHELGHHQRGDLFANWIALAVLAIHWFNPLAWRAFRTFRADQELANDARVLAGRSRTDRHIYACAIVKAAHGGAVAATCHLHTITDLKGRLRMLTIARLSRTRLAAGAAAVTALVGTGLLVTASGSEAAARLTAGVESASGIAIAEPALPATPAAPARPARPAKLAANSRHAIQRVTIVRDGHAVTYEGAAAARYIAEHPVPVPPVPPVPPAPATGPLPPAPPAPTLVSGVTIRNGQSVIVTNGDCQPLTGPSVMRQDRGGRREMIVCRNRIEAGAARAHAEAQRALAEADRATRMAEYSAVQAERQGRFAERQAALAEQTAARARRAGLAQGLAGIAAARRSIETNRNLTEPQRREALTGLADAEREMRETIDD